MSTVEDLLQKTAQFLAQRHRLLESTYRLQFHAGFTFRDACAIVPYLSELGITHCYASPYLQARAGSQHGYDITNHRALNPEIGSEAEYDAFVAALHAHGMGQILDIVPNHMGIVGNDNAWWNDVLENGPSSPYAGYFDIGWHDSPRPNLHNRVLLPILAEPYGQALEARQIRLAYAVGTFTLHYADHRFPVSLQSYAQILRTNLEELQSTLGANVAALHEYNNILISASNLPNHTETNPARVAEYQREQEAIKQRLATLTESCAEVRDSVARTVALLNGTAGEPHSFDALERLLDEQAYRLAFWRVASDEINYRRFFDINELAALNMEKPEVFAATHELVLRLLAQGKADGLRIDHIDGLYDPKQYLRRLQQHYVLACAREVARADPVWHGRDWQELERSLLEMIGEAGPDGAPGLPGCPLYVVVEKILGANEQLPPDWDTHGTSGYDFVNVVNGLFVDPGGEQPLTRLYQQRTGTAPFAEVVYQNKLLILQTALASELQMLTSQLDRLAQHDRSSRDFTLNGLRFALAQVIASFPVYRSYISAEGVHDSDYKYVEAAVRRASTRNPTLSRSLFRFVRDILLLRDPESTVEEDRAEQCHFAGKFQQVTAPVMAMGLEDTSFYVYNRLLALNEVGGDPARFGVAPGAVHQFHQSRQAKWPRALSPLSTHDTKRGEDVRARLNVLSELPEEWGECLERWSLFNAPHRTLVDEVFVPDANEEYLLYQTLLGAWPAVPCGPEEYAEFVERIQEYMVKALHEAKVHTSWINPYEAYDDAVRQFVARILDEQLSGPFLQDLRAFQQRVSHFGLLNGLAQTLLKITLPGVADTYQGTEWWDFSLVDPDNRRPVDYERRHESLRALQNQTARAGPDRRELARALTRSMQDGRIKLYVTTQSLHCRRNHPGLFSTGEYLPAEATGPGRDHVFGFSRRLGDRQAIVAVPRLLTRLVPGPEGLPLGAEVWRNTRLLLPGVEPEPRWHNLFTGEILTCVELQGRPALSLADVFAHFPVALLLSRSEGPSEERRAGMMTIEKS
ncbi:MAG: malto-oligosyltrehalose synthase [Isosphaeraceae bacterium]|nr:malto-oligosyltrehalose synthase [Isosphaeraceae bacterium]